VQEIKLAPFQRRLGSVGSVLGTRLHTADMANVLDVVDGAEAAITSRDAVRGDGKAARQAESLHHWGRSKRVDATLCDCVGGGMIRRD
jgi:hypothetical protein